MTEEIKTPAPQSHAIAAWRYRYEPKLQWHVVEFVDQIPQKEEWPLLEVEPLYAALMIEHQEVAK